MKTFITCVMALFSAIAFTQEFDTSVPKVSFKESIYYVDEGGSVEVCLSLDFSYSSKYWA